MSLISESLKRAGDQRAGRKQAPVFPRKLNGKRPGDTKRLLVLLGLTILLAGVVIGLVVHGIIQRKAGQDAAQEAPIPIPQQVIFDKITPPAEPSKADVKDELEQTREPKEDKRTPEKPKVVQVAIEQEPVSSKEAVKKPARRVVKDDAEQPIKTATIKPGGPAVENGEQPLQPGNKVKVSKVSLHSATKVEPQKEPLMAENKGQTMVPRGEKGKGGNLAASESAGQAKTIVIDRGTQLNSAKSKGSGQVNLYAESTVGAVFLYRKAVSYQKDMEWQKAIDTYNELLKVEPMSAEVYNNLGVCYEKQGQMKMAAQSYDKAISINPRFYPSYNNLGIIYYRLKNFDKARAAYEQALQLNPSNSQSEVNLALVYERLRRSELARRTLERVLTNDPENPEAHYNLARILEEEGQHEKALNHYRQFLTAYPSAYPQLREKVKDRVRTLEGPSSE